MNWEWISAMSYVGIVDCVVTGYVGIGYVEIGCIGSELIIVLGLWPVFRLWVMLEILSSVGNIEKYWIYE